MELSIRDGELESVNILQHLLDNLDDAVYRVNLTTGCYEYLSPSFSTLTGYDSDGFVKESDFVKVLLKPEFRDYYESNKCCSLKTGQSRELRYAINDSQGEKKWILQTIKPHVLASGQVIAFDGVYRDITDQHKAKEDMSRYSDRLEAMVEERTSRVESLNKDLVEASRRASMAEVATGVLHNVGNVLNSVNTSVAISSRSLYQMDSHGFVKACRLLQQNKGNIGYFLDESLTGSRLLEYLSRLSNFQANVCSNLKKEMHSLKENLEHIEHVISLQQSYVHAKRIKEKVILGDVIREAITMTEIEADRFGIQINQLDQCEEEVEIEVHLLLQILVNLLSNARDAVLNEDAETKNINISVSCCTEKIQIIVEDTGIGIEASKLDRIFTMGYTTKADGYGFGLHTSAGLASELNGMLSVESEGKGKGASFTLELDRP